MEVYWFMLWVITCKNSFCIGYFVQIIDEVGLRRHLWDNASGSLAMASFGNPIGIGLISYQYRNVASLPQYNELSKWA